MSKALLEPVKIGKQSIGMVMAASKENFHNFSERTILPLPKHLSHKCTQSFFVVSRQKRKIQMGIFRVCPTISHLIKN